MSFAPDLQNSEDTMEDVIFPPTDLYSDEPPLETDLHRLQMTLLIQCLEWVWRVSEAPLFAQRVRRT